MSFVPFMLFLFRLLESRPLIGIPVRPARHAVTARHPIHRRGVRRYLESSSNPDRMPARNAFCALLIATLTPTMAVGAQHTGHDASAPTHSVMPLYRAALGPFTREAGSRSPDAQAYFDQGFQLMYSFAPEEAVKSFREAQRRDSTCAMCFWGEAWARGAYLNGPMDSAGAPAAYAAAQRALSLVSSIRRPVDRALVEALGVRYAPVFSRSGRLPLDSAYARAMARANAAFPNDLDVGT